MGHTVEHAVPKASRYKVLPPKVRYLRDISLSVTGDNKEKKYIKFCTLKNVFNLKNCLK